MKNKNIKKRFFLTLVLMISIWLIALTVFFIIKRNLDKTEKLRQEIELRSSRKDEIKSLADQIVSLDPKIKTVESFVLGNNEEELVKFIETLEEMSEYSKVELKIDSIEVSKIDDKNLSESFENLNFELEVKGSWQEVIHFINLIDNLPYHIKANEALLDIADVIIEEESDSVEEIVWNGKFEFSVAKKID